MQSRGIVNRVTPDVVPERRNIDINKYLMNDNDIYMINEIIVTLITISNLING